MTASAINAEISARILAAVGMGATLPEAIDAVLGAGTYERIGGEIYDALRAKASPTRDLAAEADTMAILSEPAGYFDAPRKGKRPSWSSNPALIDPNRWPSQKRTD